jgi:membrane-bound lytic murein transglycosylase F
MSNNIKGFMIKAIKQVCAVSFSFVVFLTSLVLLLTGCSPLIPGGTFTQKLEQPNDIIQKKAGLIGESKPEFNFLGNADQYIPLIKKYAEKYNVDWVLVLSTMRQESRFNSDAISDQGAGGLMQIMPLTQIELSEKLGMKEAMSPRNNIIAGVYYFSSLLNSVEGSTKEDRFCITLAAYNAGMGRVLDAQAIARYLGENPYRWESVRNALSLLSRKNYTLHQLVWEDCRPPSGYFRDSKQTISYVNDVMGRFNRYSLALR